MQYKIHFKIIMQFFRMFVICNVCYLQCLFLEKKLERLQLSTMLKDKIQFTHFNFNLSNETTWFFSYE